MNTPANQTLWKNRKTGRVVRVRDTFTSAALNRTSVHFGFVDSKESFRSAELSQFHRNYEPVAC